MLAWAVITLVAVPAFAAGAEKTSAGESSAVSTMLEAVAGDRSASAATDTASSERGSRLRAFARLVPGRAGADTVGANEREATESGQRESSEIGADTFAIGDLLDLQLAGATVSSSISTGSVASAVAVELGDVSLLDGLVTIDGGSSTSTTAVTETLAETTRAVELGAIRTFSLGELLQALGTSPLDLACGTVEEIGARLDVDASNTCEDLAIARALVDDAVVVLSSAQANIVTLKNSTLASVDTTTAQIATLQVQLDSLTAQKTSLEASGGGLASQKSSLESQKGSLESQKATIETQKAPLDAQRAPLDAQRSALASQKATLEAQTAGLNQSALQTQRDAQAALCDTLIGVLRTECLATLAGIDAQLALFGQLAQVSSDLSSVTSALAVVDAALAPLTASLAAVNADLSAVNASLATVNAQLGPLAGQIDSVTAQLATVTSSLAVARATLSDLNATLDGLVTSLDVIDAASGAAGTTCAAADTSLGTVGPLIPSLTTSASTIRAGLDTTCDALTSSVEALMDTSLISIDGVEFEIHAIARPDTPAVTVGGTIGSVTFGQNDPIATDLAVDGSSVDAVRAQLDTLMRDLFDEIGLGLPVPTFEFLVSETDYGKRGTDTWFAEGSMVAMRVTIPATNLVVPEAPPLGLLDNGDSLIPRASSSAGAAIPGAFGSAYGALFAASVPSNSVRFDLGVFEATGRYSPSGNLQGGGGGSAGGGGGPNGSPRQEGPLPVTGVPSSSTVLLGIGCLVAAFSIRRYALR